MTFCSVFLLLKISRKFCWCTILQKNAVFTEQYKEAGARSFCGHCHWLSESGFGIYIYVFTQQFMNTWKWFEFLLDAVSSFSFYHYFSTTSRDTFLMFYRVIQGNLFTWTYAGNAFYNVFLSCTKLLVFKIWAIAEFPFSRFRMYVRNMCNW